MNSKSIWLAEWKPLLESDEVPINTYRVIGELDRTLDRENSIVTHDAGAPRDSIMPFYTATVPHSYIGWGKSTHLGYGIPLMIGAKLANPGKFCLNLMGDGAFGMSGLDIETSVRAGAPITTVLLNNGGMATYPGGYPTARERFGTTEMTGDYAKIAEGLGAVGITVTDPVRCSTISHESSTAERRRGPRCCLTCIPTWKVVDHASASPLHTPARCARVPFRGERGRREKTAFSVRRDLAAVYVYGLAGDPVGFLGTEEDDCAGDVGSGAGAAHGDVGL